MAAGDLDSSKEDAIDLSQFRPQSRAKSSEESFPPSK